MFADAIESNVNKILSTDQKSVFSLSRKTSKNDTFSLNQDAIYKNIIVKRVELHYWKVLDELKNFWKSYSEKADKNSAKNAVATYIFVNNFWSKHYENAFHPILVIPGPKWEVHIIFIGMESVWLV